MKSEPRFLCQYCNKAFGAKQSLGGHVGKVHKYLNPVYNLKMEIREKRSQDREILSILKDELKQGKRVEYSMLHIVVSLKKQIK